VVAAHQKQVELVALHHRDRLHRLLQVDLEQPGDVLAGLLARRGHLLHLLLRRAARAGRERLGELDVRGVVGLRAEGDRVLAGIGEHVELVRAVPPIEPVSAATARNLSPRRVKMRV
jgi:hypothetical protein